MKSKKNKGRILLIILLWILFFPIMASVALFRSNRLTISAKIFSILAIWVIFFSLLKYYGNTIPTEEEPQITTSGIESTTPENNTDNTDNDIVYVTPTGKKYHLLMSCAGVNAVAKSMSEVSDNYSPCKICASSLPTTESITTNTTAVTTESETTTTPEIVTPPETSAPEETITTDINTSPDVTTETEETTVTDGDEATVYITPTGKKYHYSSSCAGANAIPKKIYEVVGSYDPCKTCAKGSTVTTYKDTVPAETTASDVTTVPDDTTEETERIVYKTKTGSKYHYSLSCAGKNGTPITISEAIELGLTLCNNCKNK